MVIKFQKRYLKYFLIFLITFGIILFCYLFYDSNYTLFNFLKNSDQPCSDKNIKDDFMRDVCSFELRGTDCSLLEDIYLKYTCFRLVQRPHMWRFVTLPSNVVDDFSSLLDECKGYAGEGSLFCVYTNVAKLAKTDLAGAECICDRLEDERLVGECNFYIASSLAMSLNGDTSEKINLIMNLCENVIHPSWRSECYYVLADELALTKPEYLEEIADACVQSNLAKYYCCAHHTTILLPFDKILGLCNIFEGLGQKHDCFFALGHINEINNKNLTCEEVPVGFKGDCFAGLGFRAGQFFDKYDSPSLICREVPFEFRDDCFTNFGLGLGIYYLGGAISTCKKVSIGSRNDCFVNLSQGITSQFVDDSSSSCNDVPISFQSDCFVGLGQVFGRQFEGDIDNGIFACEEVPVEFKSSCFYGFGQGISYWFSRDENDKTTLACNEVPFEFRDDCFAGFGYAIGTRFADGFGRDIPYCNEVLFEFRDDCFAGFNQGINSYFGGGYVDRDVLACEGIPVEFKEECLNALEGVIY